MSNLVRAPYVGNETYLVEGGLGPVFNGLEWFGLGSDPFNLMPIIEQHQKTRTKKHLRCKRNGGLSSGIVQSSSSSQVVFSPPELGKRQVHEELEGDLRHG